MNSRPVQVVAYFFAPEVSNSATGKINATVCAKQMFMSQRNCYHEPTTKFIGAPGKDAIAKLSAIMIMYICLVNVIHVVS